MISKKKDPPGILTDKMNLLVLMLLSSLGLVRGLINQNGGGVVGNNGGDSSDVLKELGVEIGNEGRTIKRKKSFFVYRMTLAAQ